MPLPVSSQASSRAKRSLGSANPEFSEQARWIWTAGEPSPVNATADFQGRFRLGEVPDSVRILISADSRHRLHVNGIRVGSGLARGYPGHYEFDSHNITPLLKPGTNVIDIRVHHWGEGTFHGLVLRAGMICEVQTGNGTPLLSSNVFWWARTAEAYEFPTPRIACQLGFEEQVDLAFEQGPVRGRPATGKNWDRPVEIGPAGTMPWGSLGLRTIPFADGNTVTPLAVRNAGTPGPEGLVLALRAGHDLGCDHRAANSEETDGIFATTFNAARAGRLKIRRSAMYGGPIRIFLDGRKIILRQGAFDFEAVTDIKRGNHILLLDWKGNTHDTDTAISLSGVDRLEQAEFPGHPGATWLFVQPGKWRERIRKAATATELQTCGAAWRPVSVAHAPAHDVYMAMTTREQPAGPASPWQPLPAKLASSSDNRLQRLVLDFGAQYIGWLEMDFVAGEGAVIELMGVEAWGPGGPQFTELMNNTARIVSRGGKQTFQSMVIRGLRYLILDIAPGKHPFQLTGTRLIEENYPWNPRGRFHCSDTRLNRIYEMCTHTLRASSLDVFVDATYEQTLWVGDTASVLIPLHYYIQGEKLLPERCLRLTAQSLERTPLVNSQVPSAWEDRLIPNWSFFWVAGVRSNYEFSGDRAFLREMLPALMKQAGAVEGCLDREDLFAFHEQVWHFLDWNGTADDPRESEKAVFCHENCLALASLQDTAWLAGEAGDNKSASRCHALAARLRRAILKHLWLPRRKAFGERRTDGKTTPIVTASTQICALRAGLFSDPEEISRKVLTPPADWVPTGTPWMWSLGALEACAHGYGADVYEGIARHWGQMLDRGASTAWEMFEGRHRKGLPTRSWCHGWSAGPAWILPAFVLGVRPSTPGWHEVVIDPQPGNLHSAEGTVPTPHGDIHVRWELKNGKIRLEYDAPEEIRVQIGTATRTKAGQ